MPWGETVLLPALQPAPGQSTTPCKPGWRYVATGLPPHAQQIPEPLGQHQTVTRARFLLRASILGVEMGGHSPAVAWVCLGLPTPSSEQPSLTQSKRGELWGLPTTLPRQPESLGAGPGMGQSQKEDTCFKSDTQVVHTCTDKAAMCL